jgi:RimJ/RimL family protein N-acetyltransferase
MNLETPRLLLRPMTDEDINPLLLIFTDPLVMASFDNIIFSREQMHAWLQRNLKHQDEYGYGLFAVILKEDGVLIGDCGLEWMELEGKTEVELGYDFRSEYWNRGLATEAAAAVRDYTLNTLRLTRVISLIRPENQASIRVAEKVGMEREREVLRGGKRYLVYAQARNA